MQRGNHRLPCFLDDSDRSGYVQFLRQSLLASGCQLHAYVLMDNLNRPDFSGGSNS